ncbi:MAG: hypothetical protein ACLTRS_05685 [Lachnospiraceae bacterium]
MNLALMEIVMADGVALDRLQEAVGDEPHAAALGTLRGVDVSLWDNVFPYLEDAVKDGLLDEALLDEAVKGVLTLQSLSRGLLNIHICQRILKRELYDGKVPTELTVARESVVLLKNRECASTEDFGSKILVLGPVQMISIECLSDYTPPVSDENSFTLLKEVGILLQAKE